MHVTGILLPIFSLPNSYGIGTMGKEAYQFVDFLKKCKQTYWQVLPIGPTSYGDSPYQSFSCLAGNPYFIDFELLEKDGLLEFADYAFLKDESLRIDYEKIYNTRFVVLNKAYNRFKNNVPNDYDEFVKNNDWVYSYAEFMTLKNLNDGRSFLEWDADYKFRNEEVMNKFRLDYKNQIEFWIFVQYEFFKQWLKLKAYANLNGIKLIGDMPIYCALDSCDVWMNPEEFQLDKKTLKPKNVAGCPPDAFTAEGQLWGNPLYDWKYMKKNGYKWWIRRVKGNMDLFDVLRIDHFRGFEAYYAIPATDKNAVNGHWEKGPNVSLFNAIKDELGELNIIAENLGFLTPSVQVMLDKLGYPGMKIIEFGFDPNGDSDAALHNLYQNLVVYPGTHDNYPIRAWYDTLDDENKKYVHEYLYFNNPWEVGNEIIRATLASVADTVIIAFQDYLQKGLEARINSPSTLGGNWVWRMEKGDMNDDLCKYIEKLTLTYRREPKENK